MQRMIERGESEKQSVRFTAYIRFGDGTWEPDLILFKFFWRPNSEISLLYIRINNVPIMYLLYFSFFFFLVNLFIFFLLCN